MEKANLIIIGELKKFLLCVEEKNNFKNLFCSKSSFTRKRKIPLSCLVLFLINMVKKSLAIELDEFYNIFSNGQISCTTSAISQQRMKLHYSFFNAWNRIQTESFFKHYKNNVKRWKGFKLIAIDGSTSYLFDKPEVREYFGTQSNQFVEKSMARLMFAYDVLNDIIIRAHIYPIKYSEHQVIPNWISRQKYDELGLYDRGFMSFKNIWLSSHYNSSFVIRSKIGFNKSIKDFVKSGKQSKVVELPITDNAIKELKKLRHKLSKDTTVKVRLLRIKLSTGEVEILATNLFDTKKYPYKCFKDLYFKRWKIETAIGINKNLMQLEIFSGLTVHAIKQDFYAMVFIYNLHSILMKQCEKAIKKKTKDRKYEYKLSRNVTLGLFKNEIVKIFLNLDPEKIIDKLTKKFINHLEPIRPNRKYERKKKKNRLKGKYQTLTNYKRAI